MPVITMNAQHSLTAALGDAEEQVAAGAGGYGRARFEVIQRARLFAAITDVLAEHGIANTTVALVVARAGVSRRTFYDLFADRDDCLIGAIDDGLTRLARYVEDCYDPTAAWPDRVRTGLAAILAFLDAERGAGLLLLADSVSTVGGEQQRRECLLADVVAVIDEGRGLTEAGPQLPPLTAEGVLGGALSILHTRFSRTEHTPAIELLGPLMSMIVLPYMGATAARRELKRSRPKTALPPPALETKRLGKLGMRLTYRTIRALSAVAERPGSSNRTIAKQADVTDQGQMSRLLARLQSLGLIENAGAGAARGEPNAWTLTAKGWQVQAALSEQSTTV